MKKTKAKKTPYMCGECAEPLSEDTMKSTKDGLLLCSDCFKEYMDSPEEEEDE